MDHDTWVVSFLEPDLKTTIGKIRYKTTLEKIRELYEKYGVDKKLEDRSAFEFAMQQHRGSIWLNIPYGHYLKLKKGQ